MSPNSEREILDLLIEAHQRCVRDIERAAKNSKSMRVGRESNEWIAMIQRSARVYVALMEFRKMIGSKEVSQ